MLVSILDDNTYMIGEKTYKVGDEIDLGEVGPVEVFGCSVSVATLNETLIRVADMIKEIRQDICSALHLSDESWDPKIAQDVLRYENAQRDWLYGSDTLFKRIQQHIGGSLPMSRDPKTGAVTVRQKTDKEALNFLRDVCAGTVKFNSYEGPRQVALGLVSREDCRIESTMHIEQGMPCVSLKLDNKTSMAESVASAATNSFEDLLKFGFPVLIIWDTGEDVFMFDARALAQRPNMDPKALINAAINKIGASALGAPKGIGTLTYGVLGFIDAKANGVLASWTTKEAATHWACRLHDNNEFDTASSGEGTKLEAGIDHAIKTQLEREEKPKE